MAQVTRSPARRRPIDKTPSPATEDKARKRRSGLIFTALILAVILTVIGLGYYFIYVRPFQYPIIVVGDQSINIGYFISFSLHFWEYI